MEKIPSSYTFDRPYEACAVFAIYADPAAAQTTSCGLQALQHRGQETAGIVTTDNKAFYRHVGTGLVHEICSDGAIAQLSGALAVGHTSYVPFHALDTIQPLSSKHCALAFNGILTSTKRLRSCLAANNIPLPPVITEAGLMTAAIDFYLEQGFALEQALIHIYPLLEGAFSAVILTKQAIAAFRDRKGIRPLSIGKQGVTYAIASETCALDVIGIPVLRDVRPGEIVTVDQRGLASYQVAQSQQKLDIFEFVYFARPDSLLLGQRVHTVRKQFGRELAKESRIMADCVVPIPDSALPAAQGYAEESGIPLNMAIFKNHYIHRTSIQRNSVLRQRALAMKLSPIPESLVGKRIILIDDSLVTGTTLRKTIDLVRAAGAGEIHVMISSPPIVAFDPYSINPQDESELIAAHRNEDGIAAYLNADSLHYLSYAGMIRATYLPEDVFWTKSFGSPVRSANELAVI